MGKQSGDKYDAIVVGLGAMGAAALYQLAKRGLNILGIDRFEPPHKLGSTHGTARVMRRAIGEGEHYSPMALRSYEIFREIEVETGIALLDVTGMLVISQSDSTRVTTESGFFDNTVAAAQRYGIKHDVLDARDIQRRFPQFAVGPSERGYFEYGAGYLQPESCVRAQLLLATQHGAAINFNETVEAVSPMTDSDGVTVKTNSRSYIADQVITAAGPWMPELLKTRIGNCLSVQRQVQIQMDVTDCYETFKPEKCPMFFWQFAGGDRWIYGFPAISGPDGGLLVSAPDRTAPVTPDSVQRAVSAREISEMYSEYISPALPSLVGHVERSTVCLITVTADGEFIIDRHPDMANVIVCSPCSGHGFKHSAAIGEALAEMVVDGKPTLDVSRFSLSRLVQPAQL